MALGLVTRVHQLPHHIPTQHGLGLALHRPLRRPRVTRSARGDGHEVFHQYHYPDNVAAASRDRREPIHLRGREVTKCERAVVPAEENRIAADDQAEEDVGVEAGGLRWEPVFDEVDGRVHHPHYPDSPSATNRRPSESIRERGREVIKRERAVQEWLRRIESPRRIKPSRMAAWKPKETAGSGSLMKSKKGSITTSLKRPPGQRFGGGGIEMTRNDEVRGEMSSSDDILARREVASDCI
jgi:hypothetical protein